MTTSWQEIQTELHASVTDAPPGLAAADALCLTCVGLFEVDGAAVSLVVDGLSSGTFGSSGQESRRLDEYQFTLGEGPCLDAVATRHPVLVPDLGAPEERRWPMFRSALLGDGVHGVFAVPIMLTSECVGALDLFRERPGVLEGDALAGAMLAAELASAPLLDLIAQAQRDAATEDASLADEDRPDDPEGTPSVEESGPIDTDRVEVYQATGILIAALDIDAAEALLRLRAHAMATGRTAAQVAHDIIGGRLMLNSDNPDDPGPRGSGGGQGGPR